MKEAEVYRALLELENVVETHVVYGEYDLAARIDFKDDKEMSTILIGDFRNIPGVEQTETLICLLYTSPSPRDKRQSRMPSSA